MAPGTDPSCVATCVGGQPREAGVKKSRAQRRKIRERRCTIRHAIRNSSLLSKQTNLGVGSCVVENPTGCLRSSGFTAIAATNSSAPIFAESFEPRFCALEALICNIHWCLIGQFHQLYVDAKDEVNNISSVVLNPSATVFVPGEPVPTNAEDLDACTSNGGDTTVPKLQGDWRCMPEDAWEVIFDRFKDDPVSHESNEASSEGYGDICIGCNLSLSPDSESADTCDRCGALHHSGCLHEVPHPVEPYRVCLSCAPLMQAHAVVGEALELSTSSERPPDLGNKMQDRTCAHAADEFEISEAQRGEQLAMVDCRLDFMVRYLELDQHGTLAPELRRAILQKVKKTQTWKKQHRSLRALKDKIMDLDKTMDSLLRKFSASSP